MTSPSTKRHKLPEAIGLWASIVVFYFYPMISYQLVCFSLIVGNMIFATVMERKEGVLDTLIIGAIIGILECIVFYVTSQVLIGIGMTS